MSWREAWRRASRALPAPFLAPRVRLRQALVLGFQPGRHVARDEYRDARADVLFEQPHDEAQPPPGKVGQRLVDAGARDLGVQLSLHRLVHCPSRRHRVMRLALQARAAASSTAGLAWASNSAAGSSRQAETPAPTA